MNPNEDMSGPSVACPTDERDGMAGCGSTNLFGPDDEGYYDCGGCGLFFQIDG